MWPTPGPKGRHPVGAAVTALTTSGTYAEVVLAPATLDSIHRPRHLAAGTPRSRSAPARPRRRPARFSCTR
ncbi:hypothetical protein T261_01558 [Streptomyces lydicus]|nr:hypothetical protein T261_01558 [Streptomyces lydicus]